MRFKIDFSGMWQKAGVHIQLCQNVPVWPEMLIREAELFWQHALKGQGTLFNGRLSSLISGNEKDGKLSLILGEICYREQLFSNHKVTEWLADGNDHFAARGLGISTVVETADGHVMMIRRSEQVSGHAGFLDVIGGHVHPVDHAPDGDTPDVFFAIEDEVRSELGVSVDRIAETVCIGLLENSEWRKPELVFVSRLELTRTEIEAFSKHAEEKFEYSELLAIGATSEQVSNFLEQAGAECTPSAEGSLHLYRNYLHDANAETAPGKWQKYLL